MPLMRLGSFVFGVPTFSYEGLSRKVSARVESQPVIGAAPPTHLLGRNADTLSLTCTFYPFHLNGAGLLQLRGMQEAVKAQTPMMFVSVGGMVFGRWIITDIDEQQSHIHRSGTPQQVDANINLVEYIGGGGSGGLSIGGINVDLF